MVGKPMTLRTMPVNLLIILVAFLQKKNWAVNQFFCSQYRKDCLLQLDKWQYLQMIKMGTGLKNAFT